MKAKTRQIASVDSPLSMKQQISISLWTKSCCILCLLIIPHHIIQGWNVSAEELTQAEETTEALPSEKKMDLIPPTPSESAPKQSQNPELGAFLIQASPISLAKTEHHIEKREIHESDISARTPDSTSEIVASQHKFFPSAASEIPDEQRHIPRSSPLRLAQGHSTETQRKDSSGLKLKRSWQGLPHDANRTQFPSHQFKIDASNLPTPSSLPKFQNHQTTSNLSDRPSNQTTHQRSNPSPIIPKARLIIQNLRNISAQQRTTQNFYQSHQPLKQHFRVPPSTPLSWKNRKSLASPKGKPANGFVFISSLFGKRRNPFGRGVEFHNGVDLVGAKGIPILATAEGRVSRRRGNRGYGVHVIIDHGYGYETLYAHLSKKKVKPNQIVKRGQIVGFLGSTGRSTGPHLHYSVYLNRQAVDPKPYIFK